MINFMLLSLMLLLVVLIIWFIIPIVRSRFRGLITWKRSILLTGLYLGILIIQVPVLYSFTDKDFIKLIDNKDQASTQSENVINNMFKQLHISSNSQKVLYRLSNQTFEVETEKVLLRVDLPVYAEDYRIFVERKDVDDEVIEVSTYTNRLVGGGHLSTLSLPIDVSFQNGILSFMSHKKFEFKRFSPDFTSNQFKKEDSGNRNEMLTSNFSGQIIFIRVPKSLEIDKGNYHDQIQMLSNT